jgi:putative transcriptional regulator
MKEPEFEWDAVKAARSEADHGVTFEMARDVFKDPFAAEWLDDREDYGEDRYVIIGLVKNRLLFVAYTMRVRPFASYRPEERNRMNADNTMKKTAKPSKRDWSRFDAMSEAQRHAAAMSDRDALPLTPADFKRMKRTPQVKLIRRALSLTQEEFAGRFHIPLGTLRDWEQGAAVPDQSARAYLTVIARDPEAVRKALASDV